MSKKNFFYSMGEAMVNISFGTCFVLSVAGATIAGTILAILKLTSIPNIDISNGAQVLLFLIYYGSIAIFSILILTVVSKSFTYFSGKLVMWAFPNDSEPPLSVSILPEQDDVRGGYIFKQILLINQIPQELFSCYATIVNFFIVLDNGERKPIKPTADELAWAKSNSGITNNRVNLVTGISTRLYIAKINPKKKYAELVGTNNYFTPISMGNYLMNIRFDGSNFAPQMFSLTFSYDGKKSIEFKNISRLSKILFGNAEVKTG